MKDLIGIVGAMGEEVDAFIKDMEVESEKEYAGMTFYRGWLCEKEVVVVRCGIGKVNSAICAQVMIDRFDVDLLINAGVAGGLAAEIEVGDIVISNDVLTHDMDCTPAGCALGEIPRMEKWIFEADKDIAGLFFDTSCKVNKEIRTYMGRVVTGDQFIAGKEKKEYLAENFGGVCAEMEGVALAQAAYLNKKPFVIIRAISDKADGTAGVDYATFKDGAIVHMVRLVEETLKEM